MSIEVAGPKYPADVQAALDRGRDEGWTLEVYQAALSIALGHLDGVQAKPLVLEMVFMYAEEDITYDEPRMMRDDVTQEWVWSTAPATVRQGHVYIVCPHCLLPTEPTNIESGSEWRRTYWDYDDDAGAFPEPEHSIGDSEDFTCDESWYQCNNTPCWGRLDLPSWLEPEYGG